MAQGQGASATAGNASEYLESVRHPGFTKLDDFPLIRPEGIDHPWLLAFSTMARRDDVVIDFTAGAGELWRRRLEAVLAPLSLVWLNLEHGSEIAIVNSNLMDAQAAKSPVADAAVVLEPGFAVAFTTADCLPIICVSNKPRLAVAIHAGWRSLAAGIIEGCIDLLQKQYGAITAGLEFWIGPAIAAADYEVSEEVRQALLTRPAIRANVQAAAEADVQAAADAANRTISRYEATADSSTDTLAAHADSSADASAAHANSSQLFVPTRPGHYLADLPAAATVILASLGVPAASIRRHPLSTAQSPLLHSLRRDRGSTGRMATVVGIKDE
jgi:YfiH family protein